MRSRGKWMILALVVVLAAALVAAGCGSTGGQSGEAKSDLAAVKAAGTIVFGTDSTYPPMEYTDEKGAIIGFDVDLAKEIGKRLGVKTDVVSAEWAGILPGLNARKYDAVISSMNITEERLKEVNFSDPYVLMGQMIVVKTSDNRIAKLEDLGGKVIAVQIGTTSEEIATKISGVKDGDVKRFNSAQDALTELGNGKADAVITDEPVVRYYVAKKPGVYKTVGTAFDTAPMGIALRKSDPELLAAINKALVDMRADGTFDRISNQWFGFVIPNK